MRNWNEMQPELFGADGPATLFDASTLAHADDKCGTPDMFAAAEAEVPAAPAAPKGATPEARMIARLEDKGYTRSDIMFALAALCISFGDEIEAGEADALIRERIDGAPCGCWNAVNLERCIHTV